MDILGGRRYGQDTVYEEWGKNESLNAISVQVFLFESVQQKTKIIITTKLHIDTIFIFNNLNHRSWEMFQFYNLNHRSLQPIDSHDVL